MRKNSVKRTLASGGTAVGLMALELGTLGSARLADSAGADFVMCVTVVFCWNRDSGHRAELVGLVALQAADRGSGEDRGLLVARM